MYRKEIFHFHEGKPLKVIVRNYQKSDFEELIQIQRESFPPPFPSELWWNEEQLTNHVTLFPEGALCLEVEGEIAGSMTGLLVPFDPKHPKHTWEEITDNGYIRNHEPNGNTLYVVDICIRPSYRNHKLGKVLMDSMYDVVVHKGLERLLGGGRMPGYHKLASEMTPEEYLQKVLSGEVRDPVISFLLMCGRTPVTLVENYLADEESHNFGVLMEWRNPFKQQ
ncbi:GNAT family N-acetyltransferase [Anaerobacillus alkaliphilus]|uniref:GNAT family N-acetyltransferase n=1 Tax=Anaerobacillus alkaliphilus TaxID=1548597 RepID=A0A4Q0VZY8_9BACI|nr:GNAT family N-acetyltransferase [Anaerobacillus alkaliphilus]RXJ04131.1 GNAT family N-acetyltransferase [Anaerobacillus alkaliphilus]